MLSLTCLLLAGQLAQIPDDFPNEIQARARAATVRVYNPAKKSEGSGVIVGQAKGFVFVLTAQHVVTGADGVEITVFAENPKAHKIYRNASVVARSASVRDLAMIRVPAGDKTLGVLPICPVGETLRTDSFRALSLGCGDGQAPTAIVHPALSKKKIGQKADPATAYFWETAGTVAKGRSGGPLIDSRGFIIGICSGTSDGRGYHAHIDEIHRLLKEHGFGWLAEKR